MKIKELEQLINHLHANTDVSVTILWNGNESQAVSTYDIGYDINEHGDFVLQIAVYDSDLEQSSSEVK